MNKLLLISFLFIAANAQAMGGKEGHSLGGGLMLTTPTQSDLDKVTDEIAVAGLDKMGTGMELFFNYKYRFANMWALMVRPSYFTQGTSGAGHKIDLTGYTLFPIVRLYPLENDFIHFFMQVGLGYGAMNGKYSGPNGSVDWKGSAFGALGGLGAEFCFGQSGDHCFGVEGNLRYLPFERNLIGSFSGTPDGFDAPISGGELENNNKDVATTLSGIQGVIAYQFQF